MAKTNADHVKEPTAAPDKTPATNTADGPARFRREAERFIRSELAARLVVLTEDGHHAELKDSLANTNLHHNMSSTSAQWVGFYYLLNARLCDAFKGGPCVSGSHP